MKYGIIYKATSPSGKSYIGQTVRQFSWRIAEHYRYAKKPNFKGKFVNALRKYGDQIKWSIIYQHVPSSMLNALEMRTISRYDSMKNGYNCTSGGGSKTVFSEETRRKISEAAKGNKRCLGRKLSDETKHKIAAGSKGNKIWVGRHHTEESKRKISEAKKGTKTWLGKHHSEETKRKLSKAKQGNVIWVGKRHSEESEQKMSAAKKGRKMSEEAKKNMSEAMKRWHAERKQQNNAGGEQ